MRWYHLSYSLFSKKTFVRKKGSVIFKSNLCFLFILQVSTHFCLTYRQNQQSQPLLEVVEVLWFSCSLWQWQTDHPCWLPPQLSRREKFRRWLLLGWRLEYTTVTVSMSVPHIPAARASSPLSVPLLRLGCPLDSGIVKFNLWLKRFKVLTKWWFCFLHINLWSTGWKELDHRVRQEDSSLL